MSLEALQARMNRHLEHASLVFAPDNELGTHHGLSWADFMLLTALDAASGAVPATELARILRTRKGAPCHPMTFAQASMGYGDDCVAVRCAIPVRQGWPTQRGAG